MKIHHIRNATFVIEAGKEFILIDPMLSKKNKLLPFAVLKHKAKRNPTVELPDNTEALLSKVTHCLITHCQRKHLDHLDNAGEEFLRERSIPITCSIDDKDYLLKRGLKVTKAIKEWQPSEFLGGKITAIPAQHGHGWVHKIMANGIGFQIELSEEPSIYISGDTVLTNDVKRALTELKPDIAVVASGYASIDIGKPILMSLEEIIEFTQLAPNLVFSNHLESLNHCKMTRSHLRDALQEKSLLEKTWMPDDGDNITALCPKDQPIKWQSNYLDNA